jgi:LacI family transcriptional regulator
MARRRTPDSMTRRPSLADVAKAAGVSNSAVSKVIRDAYGVSPLMRAKVEDAIKKLGYRPRPGARALRGKSHLIGIQVPNFGNDFFTQIIEGIQARLSDTEYQIIIAPPNLDEDGRETLEALIDHQVDGILAVALDVSPEDIVTTARKVPFVMIGRHDTSHEYDSVYSDDEAGALLALEFFFDQGHRKIAHITLDPTFDRRDAKNPHQVRLDTYLKFMKARNLEPAVIYCEYGKPESFNQVEELIKSKKCPTAIFAGHDQLAIELLGVIANSGKSTKDVELIGYDDSVLSSHPMIGLSTVRQFGDQLGRKATELLLERIANERETANHLSITPKLILRKTTQAD